MGRSSAELICGRYLRGDDQRALAELMLVEQKPDIARDMYSKLAAAHPDDITSNMRTAELYEDVDWPKAEAPSGFTPFASNACTALAPCCATMSRRRSVPS